MAVSIPGVLLHRLGWRRLSGGDHGGRRHETLRRHVNDQISQSKLAALVVLAEKL